MIRQPGGFIQLWLVAAAVFALSVALLGLQSYRLKAVKSEYATFRAEVKAKGEEQERQAKAKAERDSKIAKEKNDDATRRYAALAERYQRMRDTNAYRGLLPAAAPGTASADRACFNRADLDRALAGLEAGVLGIIEPGDKAITGLNVAREWFREIAR